VPGANVAIATGAVSGLVVVDIDCKDVDGFAAWCALMSRLGVPYHQTRTVVTPSGGEHWYYRHPGRDVPNSAGVLAPGVDVRGDGGFVLAPPSRNGVGVYELARDVPIVPLPAALADLVFRPPAAAPEPKLGPLERLRRRLDRPNVTGTGYARAALEGEVQNVIDAGNGTRNHALNLAAFKLGGLADLDDHEIERALLAAAGTTGLVDDDGETQCMATIRSGLSAGRARPR
jgi:hypothetical protein